MKSQSVPLSEVCQHINADEAAAILGWKPGTLRSFVCREQLKLGAEWHWIKGVCYFQTGTHARTMYNGHILRLWSIARSQNDVSIYLDAITNFQRAIGR